MQKTDLKKGVNLGGWISQYQKYDIGHFDSFITENDIALIASWGMDHVRLPVDYPVLEDDERPGEFKASGFAYLDNCLEWCRTHGLRLVLDLHRAPGYSFTNTLAGAAEALNQLFVDEALQARFINLWEAITRRYLGQAESVLAFELLNEMVLPDSTPWNRLAQRTIDHLRTMDQERLIVIGGNHYNAVTELKNIALDPDPNLLYTFHCYEPLVVTHQKAAWVPGIYQFSQTVHYPGIPAGFGEFLQANPEYQSLYQFSAGKYLDKGFLYAVIEPAVQFMQATGKTLYCGEFGVIDQAPIQTRINWTRDFIEILGENQIGYALWTYKQMDFGLVDGGGKVINAELVKIASQG